MTETQTPGRKPKKKKNKESHNAVERHRKEKINAGINRIGNVLPCSQALKQSKIMILDQAFRYITELKKQNDNMLLEGGDKVQAEEIRRLRYQLEELRKESAHYMELLKAHDILEDPSIHWKGKQRCAKFGKVTPTQQIQKGIIVYSSGNVMCPAGKDTSPGKHPTETIVLQQPSEVGARLKMNRALLQVSTSSPTPSLLPGSALASQQSTPALRVVEQCVVETPAVAPSLPPSVSYITLQIPAVTTALPQQPQPPAPVQTFTVSSTSSSQLLSESAAIPVTSLTSLTQTIPPPRPTTADICSWATPDAAIRTVGYTAVRHNQPLLRGVAAGSTQTTWTTLQMAGNTVQPVCQSLPTPEVSNTTQAVQQVTVCPITNKPSVQPIQIQMQPGHIQTQLRPTILTQGQPASSQPSCAVLAQSAIVPQPTVMAHSTIVSQAQSAVIQPAPLVTHPPVLSHPQPALVHQPQATVLPLLQTMQVLQVKTASAAASGVTAPQSTNNPSVVILQQANTCPPQPVVREEITNQTACQHIVIIQAPNQSASAPQNPPVAMASSVPTLPAVSAQIPSTSSSTSVASLQTVGGKQLVHILPRPVQPQQNKCQHVAPVTTSTAVTVTPQTITVNGQVFTLQPVKASDKLISKGGQSTLQLVQPTTTEEPTTNVALNSLGALSSLNQSITQGVPLTISSQNNNQPLPLSTSVQQQPPAPTAISGSTVALPVSQLQVPSLKSVKSAPVVNATKSSGRKLQSLPAKKATVKKNKPVKNKELKQKQPSVAILAKPTTVTSESQAVSNVLQSSTVVTQITSSSTTALTSTTMTTSPDCNQRTINVTTTQGTAKIIVSSDELAVSNAQSIGSVSATQTELILNTTNASTLTTAITTISQRPVVSPSTISQIKPALVARTKISIPEVKLQTPCAESSTTQKNTTDTTLSGQTESLSCGLETLHHTNSTNSMSTATMSATKNPARSSSVCRPHGSDIPEATPCIRSEPAPTSAASITQPLVSLVSPFSSAPNTITVTSFGARRVVTASSGLTQKTDINTSRPSSCRPPEAKPPQCPRTEREAQEERHNTATVTERESPVTVNSEIATKKDFTLNQRVYTNLDDQTMEPSMTLSRQTESPMSTVAGGRMFSVASMLPQGHSISAASGSFTTFTFTSEQAEMLALAMLEQDSPDRKTGGCSGDKTSSSNPSTATWEPTKTPPVSTAKECGSVAGQQVKLHKPMDTVKTAVHLSVRGQVGEGCGLSGSRHPQNISYSQSVPQPQNSTHTSTATSLSVNNLIRPNSSQQPYPGSPNLAGQQTPVPSPVGTTTHTSHPSNNTLSPCSGVAQNNEYTPLKTALLRAQAGVSVGERQLKIIPKRQAQEEVILNSGKRSKPCPPSGNTVNHMEVKGPDHSQLMVGQLPPTSSAVMTRINSESGGSLFSNPFMSPVVRPSDGHCPPQGPSEQNQPGVLHRPQGHSQHVTSQSGPHLGGNPYMKQEQQRQHLYHLQQHLTQPDPAQRHSLHQRALQQQQEQQQQHAQKKRGLVRGSQTASPAALQQKQQQQAQQHSQQSHQQHQQTPQHSQPHPQQHPQQSHQQQAQNQHQQHPQQLQQSSHSRHHQHLQQQIQQQQQQQHFRHQDKSCEAQATGPRPHHSSHLVQQDHLKAGQDHNAMQRMMSSRNLEQTLISPPSNPVSRSSDLACAPSRQERHRVSNYSAEALIGKSSTSDQQRMSLHLQPGRGAAQEQPDLRGYLETSRTKANITHNPQNRLPSDHPGSADVQRISECPSFKAMGGPHQLGGFEVQVSRGNDMTAKSGPPAQRGPQGQQPGGFRMGGGPPADARNRGAYNGPHAGSQGMQVGPALSREQEGCHQSFMQSLLSPHLPEQSNHQQLVQCCPPVSMEYSCVSGSSSADIQGKASSPSVLQTQKAPAMRLGEGNKGHISQVGGNMHGGPGVRTGLSHPPTPHNSSEPGRSSAPSRPPTSVSQHSRHIARDTQPTKLRPGDRPRSGTLRPSNPFEFEGHLPLSTGGGVLLGRPQSGGEARRSTIVRFMPDTTQVPSDNNLVPDQPLTQNFGFPIIPEGGMNPPPPINANSTFIPPVSQPSASRTPSLLPVEPQNTLPSFYPSYSPAAHPSLPSDVTLQYFPNQMFTSPSADKGSGPPLNNRFGSILSPPRPVGFGQASFPLLPEMPPMPPIANSSGITPHISNFSFTSLFPEMSTGMPPDGSAMPMSPLLSLSNTSSADSGKQPNRPAHNISHILGHDGSSAV